MASPQIGNYLPETELPLSHFNDLEYMFTQTYWAEITNSIRLLLEEQKSFRHICKVQDDRRWVRIEGRTLSDPGEWCLWIKDVTQDVERNQEQDTERHSHETMVNTLQSLLDSLPFLVWHRDESQKINYCNKYFSDAVGVTQREAAKGNIELIPSAKARALARSALNTVQSQSYTSHAILFGERKVIKIFEEPNPLGDGTIGYAVDNTEIEETKLTLGKIIDSFIDILDHQSTAIAIYGSDAQLNYFNKAYQRLVEMEEKWLKGKPHLEEVIDELRARRLLPEYADFPAYKKRRLLALKEQLETQEELIHLPNGRTLRSISTPHPTGGLLYMYEDVTDHLKLESRNKALMEVQETTLENLYEGIIVFGSDNKIKLSNPSFRRLWNLEEEDVSPGQHLSRVIDKIEHFFEYEGEWQDLKVRIMENATDRIPKTGQLKRTDDSVLRFLNIPLPNGDNLLSYIDITDNSRVQEALKERNDALKAADQLKSEFISKVSSDLKEPLTAINSFTDLLYNEGAGKLEGKQEEYVDGILHSSQTLLSLVNDLLDLSAIEAGQIHLEIANHDIREALEDIVAQAEEMAQEKDITINLRCSKKSGSWTFDLERLTQALNNLLSNAIQFTPKKGKITLSASIKDEQLYLYITDTGEGIPKDIQPEVFKKFVRGSNARDTAGLGLSLVKGIMELHGGNVQIASTARKGTKVTCILPKDRASNQDVAGTPLVVEYSK